MSEDKLARLMAIRAANAAKGGGAALAVEAPVAVTAEVEENGVEEAPVAAARPVAAGGIPFSADNILGGVPENTAMAEDKLDRLKAIRSGNLAKRG